jgi:hypothetical protein
MVPPAACATSKAKEELGLQVPHAPAGYARIERKARRDLAAIDKFREHDLAVGDCQGTRTIAVVDRGKGLSLLRRQYVLHHDGSLKAHRRSCLGGGGGAGVAQREHVRIANMLERSRIDLDPAFRVGKRTRPDDVETCLHASSRSAS